MGVKSRVDWSGLHDNLVADFRETREEAITRIKRMRAVVDAIIACRSPEREIKPEDFDVKEIVNELKTVERYIKKAVERAVKEEGEIEETNA